MLFRPGETQVFFTGVNHRTAMMASFTLSINQVTESSRAFLVPGASTPD
ncbi:MAG: hypothetical protein ACI9JR_003031 [Gammaproteobacteria bacterium]|jgi:hypothetical protein